MVGDPTRMQPFLLWYMAEWPDSSPIAANKLQPRHKIRTTMVTLKLYGYKTYEIKCKHTIYIIEYRYNYTRLD